MALRNLSRLARSALTIATVLLLFSLWRSSSRWMGHWGSMFLVTTAEPQIDPRSLVVDQIQGVSELTTAIFAMEAVVPASRDRKLGNYVIGRTTLLYIAYGEIRAGIDLSHVTSDDVQIAGSSLRLRLPPPEVLDSKIDVNKSRVYDYDRGFLGLGPDTAPELQELAQRETLQRILEAACDSGVLDEANERAEAAVGQFLESTGYEDVTIEVQSFSLDECYAAGTVALSDSVRPAQFSHPLLSTD